MVVSILYDLPLGLCEGVCVCVHDILCMTMLIVTTSSSGGEKPLLVPFELAGKPLTRIANRKLDWVPGASTDVRDWIMRCPAPD